MGKYERFQRWWLFVSVTGVALIYMLFNIFYDRNLDAWRLERLKFSFGTEYLSGSRNGTTKKILFWNTMWSNTTFYFGEGDVFHDCPNVQNCWATHDRSVINVEEFDAVLFHGSELDSNDLPASRRDSQIYVFVNLESPAYRPITHSQFEHHFFNATMTYRLDSDVVWPYADVRRIDDNSVVAPNLETLWNPKLDESTDPNDTRTDKSMDNESELIKTRRKKTKPAVWFVSNCASKSGREGYANELAKHVEVDIYGKCSREVRCAKEARRDCFREVVEPDYYFYLSFENSMCQDYVTEKLWNALKYNVVPIVYGGADYTRFVPPGSSINALDFESPKALANYLKRLIAEPREYNEYFEWKKTYKIVNSNSRVICQLCQYLHENKQKKSYSSLSDWYATDKCSLSEKLKKFQYLTSQVLKYR
ncbi:alpha-(1,3)-fucosyltransferase C-like [Venturia canescens]|uniref:alpha-(1,3)-fucosyltransferase C-like n=1 Tax=Venturia canescens TaxID=32260 RepID=UPI001C9BD36D|nr:alpha-(1,3)-fucosyltransferase C-like [Venturia canescens]